ncbi:MAG: AraC family transcriptional regulator [Verrucomicrobia bacterium]|nr:AraC family transcriptional regulator [Verrucomicrobiota bacterium]MBU1857315.1 AraC family transcriptional regulator [Verrucomicrobiota bacterium]
MKKVIKSIAARSPYSCVFEKSQSGRLLPELWVVRFQTIRTMESFPRLQVIVAERQTTPVYRHEGCFRSAEKHCLFKFTLAGEGRFRTGRKEYRLPAGHGFLCEINDPATSYYYPRDGRAPWEFLYLSFISPTATTMTREFVRRHGPVFQLPADIGFIPEIMTWQRYNNQEVRITPADSAQIVANLFAALLQSKVSLDRFDAGFVLAQETRRLIRKRLRQFCNVKFLADKLGVSREHLSRVFKEQTAQAPLQYLMRQKMIEACRLIKETRLTQKEIAFEMGYDVPAHFTRSFKRIMRMTPHRFRAVGTIPTQ